MLRISFKHLVLKETPAALIVHSPELALQKRLLKAFPVSFALSDFCDILNLGLVPCQLLIVIIAQLSALL